MTEVDGIIHSIGIPSEYHRFERDRRYLFFDPNNFNWFVTDEHGAAAFEGLAMKGSIEDGAENLLLATGMTGGSGRSEAIGFVKKMAGALIETGFLFDGHYRTRGDTPSHLRKVPKIFYLHLTDKCNMKCPYCYNQDHRTENLHEQQFEGKTHQENQTRKFLSLIDEAVDLGVSEIKLTGGEALLNPDALKIAKYAKSKGMRVNLLTNAVLIDTVTAEAIARCVDTVSISLDSAKPEHHDPVRGKGTHTKVVSAIRRLKEAGVPHVHLNSVVTPVNLDQVENLLGFAWDELRVDSVTLAGTSLVVNDPDDKFGASAYELSERQFETLSASAKRFYSEPTRGGQQQLAPESLFRKHCGAGNGLVSIDPNGDVYPCQVLHHPKFRCGNVFETSLRDVLENSECLKMARSASVDAVPECKTCAVRPICGGGCRAAAFSREGDFLARDRKMCGDHFQLAVDQLWDAATIEFGLRDDSPAKGSPIHCGLD